MILVHYDGSDILIIFRAPDGQLSADPDRFPSGIPALASYVHKLQLKFGIYQVVHIMVVLKVIAMAMAMAISMAMAMTMAMTIHFSHRITGQRPALGEFHFLSLSLSTQKHDNQ